MSPLPTPVVHVDTINIHIDPTKHETAGTLTGDDTLDRYITGLADEIVADQQAAKYFRDELEAALLLAGVHVEPGITDQDLVAKVGVAVTAARTHLEALERVSVVTSRAHEFVSPSEVGVAVQDAIHQLSRAVATPPAGIEQGGAR